MKEEGDGTKHLCPWWPQALNLLPGHPRGSPEAVLNPLPSVSSSVNLEVEGEGPAPPSALNLQDCEG